MNFQLELERLIEVYSSSEERIVKFRCHSSKAILYHFITNGYPPKCALFHLSLLPAYYQEAIYDGIAWSNKDESLRHLEIDLELDCMFQNAGKMRQELSADEFEVYVDFSNKAINGAWRVKSSWVSRLLEKMGLSS
jgi:hypothetical protein